MRTTLTIEPDVERLLKLVQRKRKLGLKEVVNLALRRGLMELEAPPAPPRPFRTRVANLGTPRFAHLDSIADALASAEGENHS